MSRDASFMPLGRLLQFSLRDLSLLAVLIAVGSYSLANASDRWLQLWLSLFSIAVVSSPIFAFYRREAIRAFFVGFGLFGGLYLTLLLSALAWPNYTITGTLIAHFLPHAALQLVYYKLLPLVKEGPAPLAPLDGAGGGGLGGMGGGGGGMGGGGFFSIPEVLGQFGSAGMSPAVPSPPPGPMPPTSGPSYYPDLDTFMAVGHSLFGLIIAYSGGLAAQAIYLSRPPSETSPT
jgi:hypothetical protein